MKRLGITAAFVTGLVVGACVQEPPDPLYSRMTDEDQHLAAATVQVALETGLDNATRTWSNKNSGDSGKVTPVKTFVTDAGVFCRDYRETISVGDAEGSNLRTACRDEGGVWHPVN